jgi:putative PIG3 family NAD(P)H quinone oxidoreductase
MIAIEISKFGGPDVLVPVERPRPVPLPGEVLIKVAAAGVNRPDAMQRRGGYAPPPGASDIPGLEVAGTIAEVGPGGPGVHRIGGGYQIGDEVCALVSGGGYAEFCAAPAVQCLPVPRGLDMVAAGAIPETSFTVWNNVFDRGHLKPGEWILIHGGSSGIGTIAIQLARVLGSRVLATAGSAEKCAACERLGAERAINYRETDFVAAVRETTGGRGVDVVLDIVGGDYVPRNIEVLAVEGRLVQIALQAGSTAQLNMVPLLVKRLTITASTLRARSVQEKGVVAAAVRANVWPLLESGAVKPIIHATFPLRAAADAHRLLESGQHIGKIVLVTS